MPQTPAICVESIGKKFNMQTFGERPLGRSLKLYVKNVKSCRYCTTIKIVIKLRSDKVAEELAISLSLLLLAVLKW